MLNQGVCCLSLFISIAIALDCVFPPSVSQQFEEIRLTKKLKSFNSSCTSYNGSLIVDQNSGFTHSELVTLFANLKSFYGFLIIQNLNYETIGFIDKLEYIGDPKYPTDLFLHVKNVTSSSILISSLKRLSGAEIINNPNLNLSVHCDKFNDLFYNIRHIEGNLENCGCSLRNAVNLNRETIQTISSNCSVLWMGLIFENILDESPAKVKETFGSIEHIHSHIYFDSTRYESFDFFPNLKYLSYLGIYHNSFLLDMSLSQLERLDRLDIFGNTEAFCIPFNFLMKFIRNASRVEVLPCLDDGNLVEKSCVYNGDLLDLEDNCEIIIGILRFENKTFTQSELNKLKHMKTLFGFLKIVNTSITDLSFISNLEEIYTTVRKSDCEDNTCFHEEGSPLVLLQNVNLTEYIVPKLKYIYDGQNNGIYLTYPVALEPEVDSFYKKLVYNVYNDYIPFVISTRR